MLMRFRALARPIASVGELRADAPASRDTRSDVAATERDAMRDDRDWSSAPWRRGRLRVPHGHRSAEVDARRVRVVLTLGLSNDVAALANARVVRRGLCPLSRGARPSSTPADGRATSAMQCVPVRRLVGEGYDESGSAWAKRDRRRYWI